ncbi:pyridoxal phosphate-dependent aminotransferase [Lysinibacillus macroides]|uniref:Aminotransferase n=1 Tax=Lysinibacillus macroides TaxID=33935 RepID=A0A0M9DGB4_9BACI|nr:pyridoxal phosphate-dependent aminotransferase [Lysinibacillus macroides]KOY80279.1 aminotransferase [Lysinibacillus macroides]QPR67586.1 pyridoxal phosphate-dependent aminotransferase [Lysinibacillus macroides]
MNHLSNVAKNYPASAIRRMFELANQYEDVIKLTVGEPNFATPDYIKQAAKIGIDENLTHYVSNAGTDELRQAVARKYTLEFGEEYTSDQVMVAFGGMEAIMLALVATINPGDEVIIADPAYPNYLGQILMLGGKAVPVPVYEENAFKLKAEDVEKAVTSKTKAIILNSPSNPLGSVLNEKDTRELAEVVLKHDLIVISDEVYEKIIYDDEVHFSMAQIPEVKENVLIINSLSKTYAMTGWRVGFVIGNKDIISSMPKIQEGVASCVPPFIQKAAVAAINGPQSVVEEMVTHYKRRRGILINGLNEIPGFSCINSAGAFYAFANIKAFKKPSEEFAIELLKGAKVAVTPGSAFGKMGEGYLRFSFANSDENLIEAVNRIKNYVKENY